MCRDQLRGRIKTQENLQAYPGKIYLPAALFDQQPSKLSKLARASASASLLQPAAGSPGGGGGAGTSLLEGDGGEGAMAMLEEDGEDWGLSPIPVDVSHLGVGGGRRRRSGVRAWAGGRVCGGGV